MQKFEYFPVFTQFLVFLLRQSMNRDFFFFFFFAVKQISKMPPSTSDAADGRLESNKRVFASVWFVLAG